MPPVHAVFERLSQRTAELGGRVHLTKNVFADPALIRERYAETLPAFRALKARLDPAGVLRGGFYERFLA